MDEEISMWIIEFLVRQSIDDRVIDGLLSTLPLRYDDSRLKKALLLRRIRSEVSNGTVSEKILDMLELVRELDCNDGKVALESMKMAYCVVAVDCTVRFLDEELEKNGEYFEAMKKIWRVRVRKMEKSENSGLISESLLKWRDDLEAATRDPEICDRIISRNTRNEALKAVKDYLLEAWNDLGPSFLEKTAEFMDNNGKIGQGGTGDQRGGQVPQIVENGAMHNDVMTGGNVVVLDGDGSEERPNGEHNLQVDKPGDQMASENLEAVGVHDGKIASGGHTMDCDYTGMKSHCEHSIFAEVPEHQRGEQVSESVENAQHTIDEETQRVVEIAVRHKHVNLRGIVREPRPAKIADLGKIDEDICVSKTNGIPPPEVSQEPRPAKTADPGKMDEDICMNKNNDIPPPEVSQVKEGIDSRSNEPHCVKKNPLSETLHAGIEAQNTNDPAAVENPSAKEVHVDNVDSTQQKDNNVEDAGGKEGNSECPGDEHKVNPGRVGLTDKKPSTRTHRWEELGEDPAGASPRQPSLPSPKRRRVKGQSTPSEEDNNVEDAKRKEGNSECPGQVDEVKAGRVSLMDRKPSAHTYRWEDLGEASAGASPSQPYLPSPKRRIKRRWTPLEEDTLRNGVKKFGKGNWKLIQQAYRDVFQGRSEVDLKDKWRNLTR